MKVKIIPHGFGLGIWLNTIKTDVKTVHVWSVALGPITFWISRK